MNILRKERILSRFALRMTGYLVVVNAARRVAIRFFFLGVLRILSRLSLLRCPKVVIRLEREQLLTAAPAVARFILHCSESNVTQNDKLFVIAVRVSGGHLCEAEAPTEPTGEIAARCAAIRPLSLRGALAPWQSVLLSRGIRILSRFTYGMTKRRRNCRKKLNIRFIEKPRDR